MLKMLAKKCLIPIYAAQKLIRPTKFLFVVGHMRSGSTLLTHILNSNPDISGYGETHTPYETSEDVDRLVYEVLPTLRKVRLTTYVMDKVLNDYLQCKEIFHRADCYFLFLIRDPVSSIRSMMRQFPTWFSDTAIDRNTLQLRATERYNDRLEMIRSHTMEVGDESRTVFLTYDQLLYDTTRVFNLIEQVLELQVPLRENYNLTRTSGSHFIGDTSKHILKQQIDRNIRHEEQPLDEEKLGRAKELFEQVSCRLRSQCSSL